MQSADAVEKPVRGEVGQRRGGQLVDQRHVWFEVFEEDVRGGEFDLHLVDEFAAGQDMPDAGLGDAGIDDGGRGGVVQVDPDASHEGERRVDEATAD